MFSGPKILMLIVVIAVVIMFFRMKKKGGNEVSNDTSKASNKNEPNALEMKEDPICKSFVEDTTAFKVKLYDDIYYFCSQECKDKFIRLKKSGH